MRACTAEIASQRDERRELDRELSSPGLDGVYRRVEAETSATPKGTCVGRKRGRERARINFRARFSVSDRTRGTGLFTRNRL